MAVWLNIAIHLFSKFLGFQIDSQDNYPLEMHSDYQLATESYVIREEKKTIRVKYVPLSRLSQTDIDQVQIHLTSFQHLYNSTVKQLQKESFQFAKNYLQMLRNRTTHYER